MATTIVTDDLNSKSIETKGSDINAMGVFDNLPTEIRWRIYGFASQKPTGATLLLKQWLEQIDPNVDISQPAPNLTYVPIPEPEEDDGSDDIDSQATQERDEDDDEEDFDEDDDDEDEDEEMDDAGGDDDEAEDDDEDGEGEPIDVDQTVATVQTGDSSASAGETQEITVDDAEDEDEDAENVPDGTEPVNDEQDVERSDMDDDEDQEDGESADAPDDADAPPVAIVAAATTSNVNTVSRPGYIVSDKYVGRRNMYQHAIPIFKLNGCPPPLSLLQTCNAFHDEAIQYCYDKLVLEIDVFQGFSHLQFFEDTINLINGSSSSGPLDRIRKVKLMYFWDSAYLEKYKDPQHQLDVETVINVAMWRAGLVHTLIANSEKMSRLKLIEIEWHDSLFTQKGMDLQLNVLDAYGEKGFIANKFEEPVEIRTNVFVGTESQPWKGKGSRIKYLRRNLREVRTQHRAIG